MTSRVKTAKSMSILNYFGTKRDFSQDVSSVKIPDLNAYPKKRLLPLETEDMTTKGPLNDGEPLFGSEDTLGSHNNCIDSNKVEFVISDSSEDCEPEVKVVLPKEVKKHLKATARVSLDDEPSVGSLFNCHVGKNDGNDDILSPKFDPSLFDITSYYSKKPLDNNNGSFIFSFLTDVLQKSDDIFCSGKGSRKSVLTLLSNFFRVLIFYNPSDLIPAIYILQNRICPEYESVELGVGDSLIIKSMAEAYSKSDKTIKEMVAKHEDLGTVASLSSCTFQTIVKLPDLTISGIFLQFRSIANMVGKNSINRKRDIVKKLLISAKKNEAKYIVRYLQQKLRIGIGINTIFQCIADAFYLTRPSIGDTKAIGDVRKADLKLDYTLEDMEIAVRTAITNVPCIDKVAGCLLNGDTCQELREHCKITPGIPVRPMLAKPVNTTHEITQSIGSEGVTFTCEYKYDGERVQIHMVDGKTVTLFSRNMENLSEKYPDVIDKFLKSTKPGLTSCILDCEVVAVDGDKILPFQNLSTRKRKDVDLGNVTVQICLFPFDILYCNGESLVTLPLSKRRESMHNWLIQKEGLLIFANHKDMNSFDDIDDFLRLAVSDSCEGLMIKSLDDSATYEPQKRSNKWLKFKKDYITGMSDSVDLVPIAAFYGKGKRTSVYGSYLLAIYDPVHEIFQGICKTGTGFTDQTLKYLYDTLQQHIIPSKLPTYEVSDKLDPDVWFMPEKVWECKAADLSISPVYTAANRFTSNGKGIGLRFPRFLRDRDDKKAVDATTGEQIYEMFNNQFNKP